MAVLVEQDAEKQRDHNAYGDECVHQATGITEREVAEEGQEQEEAPVDLHVDAERPSNLERSTHGVEFTPRSAERRDPTPPLPARIQGVEERTTQGYRLVTAGEDLAAIAKTLQGAEAIGLDLETTALSPRDGAVRLLQLATPEETFVIDVFEIADLSPLRDVLEDGPVKTLHNCVPLDTNVLTPEGWRPISTISPGDTVMGYSEGRQRWATVTEYVDGGEQEVIETSNTHRRWRSTPSHRWVCQLRRGKLHTRVEEVYRTTDNLRRRP